MQAIGKIIIAQQTKSYSYFITHLHNLWPKTTFPPGTTLLAFVCEICWLSIVIFLTLYKNKSELGLFS